MEKETGYAFIDEGGVLHIVSDKADAERLTANGRVLETGAQRLHGYPAAKGKQIVIYGVNECYEDGNRNGGAKLDTEEAYPELAALYKELM